MKPMLKNAVVAIGYGAAVAVIYTIVAKMAHVPEAMDDGSLLGGVVAAVAFALRSLRARARLAAKPK